MSIPLPGDICRQSSLLHFDSCSSYAHLIYMDNVNHMYPHEILSDSIPLYIYYNYYFYCKTQEHSNFMKKGKMVISVKI